MINYKYYVEVIRNYEELLDTGYSEFEAAYLLATVLPAETAVLLMQGYFQVLNN
jgi:hypothetical protein